MFAADGMKAVNTEDRPSEVTSETSPVHSKIVANRLIPLKLRTKKSANAITITVKEMATFSKKKHPPLFVTEISCVCESRKPKQLGRWAFVPSLFVSPPPCGTEICLRPIWNSACPNPNIEMSSCKISRMP